MSQGPFLGYYKKDTTGKVWVGPFTRATNHYSILTGMTTANFNCYYAVGTACVTGTYTTALNGPWAEILAGAGYYSLYVSTLMTQAVGPGLLMFDVTASGDPLSFNYMVYTSNIWDAIVGGTGVGVLRTVAAFIGSTAATFSSGVMCTSVTALRVMENYWGSSGTTVTSGMMTSSRNAFISVKKYIGSTLTSFTSGTMATSVNALYVINKYIGSSNTTFASGVMSTSVSALRVMENYCSPR